MAFEKTKKKLAEAVKRARLKKAYVKEAKSKLKGPSVVKGKTVHEAEGRSKRQVKKDIKKAATAKAKVKAKDPATGKVRRGVKGVKSTKGGEYVKYGKKSKAAKSFRSEFAAARKAGKKAFTWDGRSYSTAMKGDKKKAAKPKKGKGVTVSSVGKKYKKPIDKKGMQVTQSAIKESMKGKKKDKVLAVKKPSNPSATEAFIERSPLGRAIKNIPKHAKKWKEMTDANVEKYKKENPDKYSQNMEEGGKVESNPYGWPTRDARNGGQK